MSEIHKQVQDYYGQRLKTSDDLQTNACCTLESPSKNIREALSLIHDEVQSKYYGCGLCIPNELVGLKVLDLGSGSGRDCYILSKLVGQEGQVVGVDMTQEQLDIANKYIDHHTEQFGYKYANVKFLKGNIESLSDLALEPNSFDLIVSNCVINLAADKRKVFSDAYQLLKPGGEIYFSDVYADRRIPQSLRKDPVLWGECLSGALYWNDFLNIAKDCGFTDPRVMKSSAITIENEDVQNKVGDIQFFSVTYRLFKLDNLESDCEDYGQAVKYLGTIEGQEASFDLDDHHNFPAGKMAPVCGNTYMMLYDTRFKGHFEFYGNFDTHYGIYEGCGGNMPFNSEEGSNGESCC